MPHDEPIETPPSRTPATGGNPAPLTVAASLVAVQGGLLLLLAAAELVHLDLRRLTMGVTTTLFFAACGAALLLCAWGLSRRATWSRSPVVLAQLIQLGLAWSFRGGSTTPVAIVLLVVAAIVLAGVFHPASTAVLVDDPTGSRAPTGDQ